MQQADDVAEFKEVGLTAMPLTEAEERSEAAQPSSQQQGQSSRTVHDTARTLYVGNLHPYVTEAVLADVFSHLGPGCFDEVKIVRCKVTGLSAGYGFVQFTDPRYAEAALATLHGRVLYGQELRLNWTFASKQQEDTSGHCQIFVGDLGNDVNHKVLLDSFMAKCPNCSDARVMWDHTSGRSKGYGFVSFRSKEDAAAAIELMSGELIGSRRVRCGWAQHKQEEAQPVDESTVDRADPSNSNVYVGNLPPGITDGELKRMFSQFGRIVETKMYRKGGYGFVRFAEHQAAVKAIVTMTGHVVRDRALKCSWGRFPNGQRVKQPSAVEHTPGLSSQAGYYMQPAAVGAMPLMPAMLPGAAMLPGGMVMGVAPAPAVWAAPTPQIRPQGTLPGTAQGLYSRQAARAGAVAHGGQQAKAGAFAHEGAMTAGGYYAAPAYPPYTQPDAV